jgi:general secretion pathway protein L
LSTLYIRLPSKAATGSTLHWSALPCPFALVSRAASIVRQGVMPLSDLSETIALAQRVVLILAASDVTLLRVKTPPLSRARLKAALPNLVEDQLIADPSECVVEAGGMSEGPRTVAVMQRTWLDALNKTLIALGARQIAALPAQLCLSHQADQSGQSGRVAVAVSELGDTIDVTLRLSEHDGIGLAISADQNKPAAHEVVRTLCAVVPEAPIALYVPQSEIPAYQQAINDSSTLNKKINVLADNWPYWITGAQASTLDLMAGLGAKTGFGLELRAWRWPLALAVTVLAVNVAALNIDWWRMKGEASALRATMTQIYRSAYPKETVIIDPVAQMQQKITAARSNAGLIAPDDFMTITSTFSKAWTSISSASGKSPSVAALEYRERSLLVRLKPFSGSAGTRDVDARDSEALTQKMKAALAERSLSLEQVPSESSTVWKIRSIK